MDQPYSPEHRGHRLVQRQSPRGNVYWLPEEYAELSISDCIRRLAAEGWSKSEINRVTRIRYQHARNVLLEETGAQSLLGKAPIDGEGVPVSAVRQGNLLDVQAEQPGTIGYILHVARHQIAVLAGVSENAVKLDLRIEVQA